MRPPASSRSEEQVALVRRKQNELLKTVGAGEYLIDVERFHTAVQGSLDDYLADLCQPASTDLRDKLWTKMDHICNIRECRGAMETLDPAAADPTA